MRSVLFDPQFKINWSGNMYHAKQYINSKKNQQITFSLANTNLYINKESDKNTTKILYKELKVT